MTRARARRLGWLALAYASAAVAVVGIVVPLLPTTPFALLAAFAATRGSERLHDRLMRHRTLGPLLVDWRRERAVPRRAKLLALAWMAVSAAILFLVAPSLWIACGVTAFLAGVAVWLWSRPEPTAVAAEAGPR